MRLANVLAMIYHNIDLIFKPSVREVRDGLPNRIGNGYRFAGVIVHADDSRFCIGRDCARSAADDPLLHSKTGISDPNDARSHRDRIRIGQRNAKVARQACDDWPDAAGRTLREELDTAKVLDPARFNPSEVGDVVHMSERILVGPQNGYFDDDRKAGQQFGRHLPILASQGGGIQYFQTRWSFSA